MSLPGVSITTGASGPSSFPQIEKIALFIGKVTSGEHVLTAIGPSTDLVGTFGAALDLVDTIEDAIVNADSTWQAWAIGYTGSETYADVIDIALAGCQPEFIVISKPVTAKANLDTFQTKAAALLALNKRVFFLVSYAGIDPGTQTWAQYLTAAAAITEAAADQRVMVTPLVFGSELGAFAGRLAKDKVSRSPSRVKSGPVVDPGAYPIDSAGVQLTLATLSALNTDRFSVFFWYEGKSGIYFGKGNTLDDPAGDFPLIEWLRVTDKAARNVRLQGITAIADDNVDNTPGGVNAFNQFLGKPLRDQVAARELKPLKKGAIVSDFTDVSDVTVSMTIQPMTAPTQITIGITLDTNSD